MHEVNDPVCGLTFPWDDARGICRHGGQLYYFCGQECRAKFAKNPVYYLTREHQGAGNQRATG